MQPKPGKALSHLSRQIFPLTRWQRTVVHMVLLNRVENVCATSTAMCARLMEVSIALEEMMTRLTCSFLIVRDALAWQQRIFARVVER